MVQNRVLSEIAYVGAGLTFRGKAESQERDSGVRLIQIKDVREAGADFSELPFADVEAAKAESYSLKEGDILVPLRGGRFEAMVCSEMKDLTVITTNQVAVIRGRHAYVSSDYLLWFFNSNLGRLELEREQVGSVQKHISLKGLSSIYVPVPGFSVQNKISHIYRNWLKRRSVLESLLSTGGEVAELACLEIMEVS